MSVFRSERMQLAARETAQEAKDRGYEGMYVWFKEFARHLDMNEDHTDDFVLAKLDELKGVDW